jgi:hypothetical protein
MQKQQKMIALASVLAIVASITVVSTLEQVQAENIGTIGGPSNLPPKSYGSATNVCGDRLCDEPQSVIDIEEHHNIGSISTEDSAAPTASLISIDKYDSGAPGQGSTVTYKITYSVTAGTEDLKDIQIHANTDLGNWDFSISSLSAHSSTVNVARLNAIDADSITGEIVHYTVVQ